MAGKDRPLKRRTKNGRAASVLRQPLDKFYRILEIPFGSLGSFQEVDCLLLDQEKSF